MGTPDHGPPSGQPGAGDCDVASQGKSGFPFEPPFSVVGGLRQRGVTYFRVPEGTGGVDGEEK